MYIQDKIDVSNRRKTREGFLVVDKARIARSGIQEYFAGELGLEDRDPFDVIKVYRPDKEVFNKDSLQSFASQLVTNNHPTGELVNSENSKNLQVGFSGELVNKDGIFVVTKLTVTDEQTIKDIESGKVQLSNGYTSEIDFEDGITNDGERYNAIQTNIKGNHIAIVNNARCGKDCKILDEDKPTKKGANTMLVIIDSVEFEISDNAAAQAVKKVLAENATLKDTNADLTSKSVTVQATHDEAISNLKTENKKVTDGLQAKLDDAESKLTPAMLDGLVATRTEIVNVAVKVIDGFESTNKDCETIKSEVVASKGVDVADKSPEYINARFDAIAENIAVGNSDDMTNAQRQHAQGINDGTAFDISEKARDKFMADSQDAWKHPMAR